MEDNSFRYFLSVSAEPVCILQAEGQVVFLNNAFSEIFGHPQKSEEWITSHIDCPEEKEIFIKILEKGFKEAVGSGKSESKSDFSIHSACFEITFHFTEKVCMLTFHAQEGNGNFSRISGFTAEVLENMDDAVVACDREGNLMLFNRVAREWHGDIHRIGSEKWSSTYGLYDKDGINQLERDQIPLARAFAGESFKDIHFTIKANDGHLIHALASGGPLVDKQGKKNGALVVMRDISDQLRYIDDIREKELAYKTLLNTIPDVLVETDLSGKIVYINDVLVIKNYIASKDELLEHNIFEFLVADDRERAYQYFMNFLSENPGTMEYKVKFSNNREVYCDVKGNLVTDPKGNPKSIIFVLRDLTEKRKAETQHRMLAHTVRSVSECISITDTSDHIIFVNEAFLKTYGYEEAELIGRPVSMVRSSSNDPALLASILPATLQAGWEGELINRRKDGYEFQIILSTSAVKNEAGEIVYMVGICKDISLQKKAERELEESRKRFQRYFENTTVGICVTSPDKGWIDVNNHLCDLLGYTKEELQTLRWDELTHPDDLPADIEQFELVLAGKIDSYLLDKRFIRKDNSIVYTSLYVAAEREPDGTLKHVLASLIDISSRKMAEEAIRQSEQRYRDLSNFLPVVIYETDLQGRLLFTNLAGYEVFGYTPLELQKGLYIWDMLEPSVAEKAADRFKILLSSGEKSSSEYLMRKKDGELFHAIITSTAIYVDGALNGVRGAIIDISDRKKKEELRIANEAAQAMIKAQRHLSLLVDQSLVGFIEMNTGLIVTSWNPSAQRIFGFTAAEAIGNNVADLILEPQDKNRIRENLAEVMKNRGGFRNINRNITRDGRVIICEWHDTAIVDTDGQLLSVVSLVADITERIEAERALKESREKLKLFATHLQDAIEEERIQISRDLHDTLGQSLTGLKIYSARVRTKILRDHNGNKTEILASLDEMIQVIDEVMQEIRRISRQLRPRILDEEGLIPAISAQIHDLMTQSGISFKLTTETNHIPVNPKHKIEIYRIVQEALTNIIRHANASAAEIRIFRENGHSRIDIKDNGIGFEESKVLQKNTLGMLGMRERATVFGGILEISGKEGEGTIVSLQIPVHN